ncbi:hypothetical protein GOV08_00290 [Candidatus Woesearchaeota archaeon]|nr:hypothetical protein [Candidatus Woesearchaeota archaeon]
MDDKTEELIGAIEDLCDDSTIPKNVRDKLQNVISTLKEEGELSIKIDKALHGIETISEDTNLQPYTRTQLWNLVSMLEQVN